MRIGMKIYILNILYSFWSRGIEIKLKFIGKHLLIQKDSAVIMS